MFSSGVSKKFKAAVMSKSKHIMIVDDEAVVRDVLCSVLEKKGYKTVAIADGDTAISYAETKKPDLILLDIKMQGLDGIKTCLRLRQTLQIEEMLRLTPRTGIMIITGCNAPQSVEKSFSAGAIDVIRKPFDLEDIISRINIWFEVRNIESKLLRQWVYKDKRNWYIQNNTQLTGSEQKKLCS